MITGDLDRVLATEVSSAGTWRPGPPGSGPATFASSAAFLLARSQGGGPARIAAALAARLTPLDWVDAATVTGGGYLTVTVTAAALARLAVRITEAGPACARSDALRGVSLTAPPAPDLAAARGWPQARDELARHLTGRLAETAGAAVTWLDDRERSATPRPLPASGPGPVAEAIGYAGADAVRFALCRLPPGGRPRLDPRAVATHQLGNPAYAVRYAHAHAASTLRQAADLGLHRGEAAGFQPRLLGHPSEQELAGAMAWLPERVAGAARRGQPDVLARYLDDLAGAYLTCQERCPAVRPGMTAEPGAAGQAGPATAPGAAGRPTAGGVTAARLWLVAAARTTLAAGLGLLGVNAPDRL
ncbi:MAG: DALR anticodon-binding domain-containing protein [Gemmatimonadota bacterium]